MALRGEALDTMDHIIGSVPYLAAFLSSCGRVRPALAPYDQAVHSRSVDDGAFCFGLQASFFHFVSKRTETCMLVGRVC